MNSDYNIVVKADFDDFNKKIIYATRLMKEFKKVSKLSIWQLFKMKIAKIFLPKPKITIQELIDKERNL